MAQTVSGLIADNCHRPGGMCSLRAHRPAQCHEPGSATAALQAVREPRPGLRDWLHIGICIIHMQGQIIAIKGCSTDPPLRRVMADLILRGGPVGDNEIICHLPSPLLFG